MSLSSKFTLFFVRDDVIILSKDNFSRYDPGFESGQCWFRIHGVEA